MNCSASRSPSSAVSGRHSGCSNCTTSPRCAEPNRRAPQRHESGRINEVAATPARDARYPPGSVVEIRDETWLVQRAERAGDGWFVDVQGLSELVRGMEATFCDPIDEIRVLDPARRRSGSTAAPATESRGCGWGRRRARRRYRSPSSLCPLRPLGSSTFSSTSSKPSVREWLDAGVEPETIGVLVRDRQMASTVEPGFGDRGVALKLIGRGAAARGKAQLMTMHRAKGMEFSRVLIFGVDADLVPADYVLNGVPDGDRADLLQRERSLFYVAATRARDELVVMWEGSGSAFLGEAADT